MTRTPVEPHSLLPGVVVLPRPPHGLVVGHDRSLVALPDSPGTRRLLDDLAGRGAHPPGPADPAEVWRAWCRLREAGLVVATAALRRAREPVRGEVPGTGLAVADAAVLAYGDDGPAVVRARRAAVASVHGPRDLRAAAVGALEAAAVPVAHGRTRHVVELVAGDVSPDPRRIATLVRRGTPHLVVVRDTSGVAVGPFVVPGHAACTGCLEATRADHDPEHGMLRLLRARALRERGMPDDPAVLGLALAVAARDVVTWAAGDQPSTWSAVRTFSHAGGEERLELSRHPRCGCAWDALEAGVDAG